MAIEGGKEGKEDREMRSGKRREKKRNKGKKKQVKVKADGIQASKQASKAKQSKAYVASRTYEADVPKGA